MGTAAGDVLGKAGSAGWGTGLSSAVAMEVSKHRFVRGPRQTVVRQHSQEKGRQVVAVLGLIGDKVRQEKFQERRVRSWG